MIHFFINIEMGYHNAVDILCVCVCVCVFGREVRVIEKGTGVCDRNAGKLIHVYVQMTYD